MSVRRLVNPTAAQLETAASVLASAFSTDPGSIFLTNGGDPSIARLHYLKTVTTAALDGELWVATVPPGARRRTESVSTIKAPPKPNTVEPKVPVEVAEKSEKEKKAETEMGKETEGEDEKGEVKNKGKGKEKDLIEERERELEEEMKRNKEKEAWEDAGVPFARGGTAAALTRRLSAGLVWAGTKAIETALGAGRTSHSDTTTNAETAVKADTNANATTDVTPATTGRRGSLFGMVGGGSSTEAAAKGADEHPHLADTGPVTMVPVRLPIGNKGVVWVRRSSLDVGGPAAGTGLDAGGPGGGGGGTVLVPAASPGPGGELEAEKQMKIAEDGHVIPPEPLATTTQPLRRASIAPEDDFGAVMCLYPPGLVYGETPNAHGPHAQAATAAYPPAGRAYFERVTTAWHELELVAYGPDRTVPTFYISHLGTRRDAQGLGLAGALLSGLMERASEWGDRVTLITQNETNVKYYTRFGFKLTSDAAVHATGFDSHWWAMVMDPTSADAGSEASKEVKERSAGEGVEGEEGEGKEDSTEGTEGSGVNSPSVNAASTVVA